MRETSSDVRSQEPVIISGREEEILRLLYEINKKLYLIQAETRSEKMEKEKLSPASRKPYFLPFFPSPPSPSKNIGYSSRVSSRRLSRLQPPLRTSAAQILAATRPLTAAPPLAAAMDQALMKTSPNQAYNIEPFINAWQIHPKNKSEDLESAMLFNDHE
ncbi:hypothetical protein E3N88_34746 [Mikania micrantha]|uniref:Uncharacterized protein n=1 Tax=Mikania micrantha TaxID=192012 RepID=A0A5N6LZV4_9ASTR|nr:hypothetical protein E3N88_34746 [Mikania micrantha]